MAELKQEDTDDFFVGLSGGLSVSSGEELKQQYICDICGISFPCQTYLNRHCKNVHVEGNEEHQKCPKCPMTFKKYDTFWEHVVRVHENPVSVAEGEGTVQAVVNANIGKVLNGDQDLEELVVPEDEEEIDALVESLVSEEDDKVCKRCGKRLCGKKNVKRHIREVHLKLPANKNQQGRVSCVECGKSFVNNSVYNSHMRNIHLNPEPTIECPKCWKKFKEMKHLRRHLKDVHLVQAEGGNSISSQPIPTNSNLNNRTSAEANHPTNDNDGDDTIFSCATCEISFVSLDGLNRHKKNVHRIIVNESPSRPHLPKMNKPSSSSLILQPFDGEEFECSECGKKFPTKNALWGHSVVHQKASLEPHIKSMLRAIFGAVCNSSLTCGICGTTVMNSVEGRLHVYIKHPEKFEELVTKNAASSQGLIQCTYCTEKMPCSEAMISHIESVHPDKHIPTCSQCGHKELKERDINLHFKQFHPDVSRYSCPVCKHPFNQRRDLEHHMNREHSANAVQCPYCPEKHVKVKLHVTVKHPEKAEEYTKLKKAAIREEQEARKRFNQFLEKGATRSKTKNSKKKNRKERRTFRDDNEDGETDHDEEDPEDDIGNPDIPEYEDDDELEDQKPNVCILKETPKVTIPELYKLQKNTTTPHMIEVHRLPPPPPPSPPPDPEPAQIPPQDEGQNLENELDIKPDVDQLKLANPTPPTEEKTLKLCLERLTQDEISKWISSQRTPTEPSTTSCPSSSPQPPQISPNLLRKQAPFTSLRGRKRRQR